MYNKTIYNAKTNCVSTQSSTPRVRSIKQRRVTLTGHNSTKTHPSKLFNDLHSGRIRFR